MDHQQTFAKVLADAAMALRSLEIPFQLIFGTALGAIRDGRFIDHDYDIDLGILREDHGPGIPQAMQGAGFVDWWSYGSLEDGYECSFVHRLGLRVDINLLYSRCDGIYAASYGGICTTFPEGKCWYRTRPYATRLLDFAGARYLVPPVAYLEETYGPGWQTPRTYSYDSHTIVTEYPSLLRPGQWRPQDGRA